MSFCRSPFQFGSLELATGIVFGEVHGAAATESGIRGANPLEELEDAVLRGLLRPPCVVSFSGGRDSSAVLAAAARAARRHGLDPPIAAANVFPGIAAADESEWQELVVSHLGLHDWVRVELRDELDCVGPLATSVLERHGLLWPFNVHFHVPLLEVARGGSLLTGIGGDELLGTSEWARAAAVLSAAAKPVPRDLLRVGAALSPQWARRAALRRRTSPRWPWLTEEGHAAFRRAWIAGTAREPLRWRRRWHWWRRRRQTDLGLRSLALVAADHDVEIDHPLCDSRFALAAGRRAAEARCFERMELAEELFSELLPTAVLRRRSKAMFDSVFWADHSRAAAGQALEQLPFEEIPEVDRDGLASTWAEPVADPHTCLLLQAWRVREASARADTNGLAIGTVGAAPARQ